MGLLSFIKRSVKNAILTWQELDDNFTKIENLFPDAAGNVGKTLVLKQDGTGFDYIDFPAQNNGTNKYLISGGAVWSGTGWTYQVTALSYFFNGTKSTNQTQVTLTAGDAEYDRIDAIVVDEAGQVSVITGVAAPSSPTPEIPTTKLLVQYVLVQANATQPDLNEEEIYLDNQEWACSTFALPNTSQIGSTDFNSQDNPQQGTKCIKNTGRNQNTVLQFQRPSGDLNANDFTTISFWVRLPQALPNGVNLLIGVGKDSTQYSGFVPLSLYGLKPNIVNQWQLVIIPIYISNLTIFNQIVIGMTGSTAGRNYDIDNIKLSSSIASTPFSPQILIAKNGGNVGSQGKLNFIEDGQVQITATNDAINNKVDIKIKAISVQQQIAAGQAIDLENLTGEELIGIVQSGVLTQMQLSQLVQILSSVVGNTENPYAGGLKFVTTSRDFEADDAGKFLVIASGTNTPIYLTMPDAHIFNEMTNIYLIFTTKGGFNSAFDEDIIETFTVPNPTPNSNIAAISEVIKLIAYDDEDRSGVTVLSVYNGNVFDEADQKYKTMTRFLYDKSENEKIITLGIITYEDINAAPADSIIELALQNTPSNFYLEKIFIEVKVATTVPINTFELQIPDLSFTQPIDVSTIFKYIVNNNPTDLELLGTTNNKLVINFDVGGGEVNPKNLTDFEIKVSALIKKFPA